MDDSMAISHNNQVERPCSEAICYKISLGTALVFMFRLQVSLSYWPVTLAACWSKWTLGLMQHGSSYTLNLWVLVSSLI